MRRRLPIDSMFLLKLIKLYYNTNRVGETPKYRENEGDKYIVDKNLSGLWQYLTKRSIDMEVNIFKSFI